MLGGFLRVPGMSLGVLAGSSGSLEGSLDSLRGSGDVIGGALGSFGGPWGSWGGLWRNPRDVLGCPCSWGSWGVLVNPLRGDLGRSLWRPGILGEPLRVVRGVLGVVLGGSLRGPGGFGGILGDFLGRLCRKPYENQWKTFKKPSSGRPWVSWRRLSGRLRGLSERLWGVLGRVGSPQEHVGTCKVRRG